jgi:hypothetical protein
MYSTACNRVIVDKRRVMLCWRSTLDCCARTNSHDRPCASLLGIGMPLPMLFFARLLALRASNKTPCSKSVMSDGDRRGCSVMWRGRGLNCLQLPDGRPGRVQGPERIGTLVAPSCDSAFNLATIPHDVTSAQQLSPINLDDEVTRTRLS